MLFLQKALAAVLGRAEVDRNCFVNLKLPYVLVISIALSVKIALYLGIYFLWREASEGGILTMAAH